MCKGIWAVSGGRAELDFSARLPMLFNDDERPHLDARARGRVVAHLRWVESGMRRKTRAAVVEAVPTLDQEYLVGSHPRRIVPALRGVMRQVVNFTNPVGEYLVSGDQIVLLHRGCIGQCKWRAFHRAADRTPDVYLDDPGADCSKTGHFVLAENILRALRSAFDGVVDMKPARRTTQAVRVLRPSRAIRTPRDVEDNDLAGAESVAQERHDLRLIHLLNGVVGVKILNRGRMAQQFESFSINGQSSTISRISEMATVWASGSKKNFISPPVSAALWNTGLISWRWMKFKDALMSVMDRGELAVIKAGEKLSFITRFLVIAGGYARAHEKKSCGLVISGIDSVAAGQTKQ